MKSLDGGTWVDLFGAVFIIRLLGPVFHLPPMNGSEAGIWMATISSFAYSNNKGGPNGHA
jgi:hypothetical protein